MNWEKIENLKKNWNTYNADPPSKIAIKNAKLVEAILIYYGKNFNIDPDVNGGVCLSSRPILNSYVEITCWNDDVIDGSISSNKDNSIDLQCFHYDDKENLIKKIKEFIDTYENQTSYSSTKRS